MSTMQIRKTKQSNYHIIQAVLCGRGPKVTTPSSARHIYHHHLIILLDNQPLSDTVAVDFCPLPAACPSGSVPGGQANVRVVAFANGTETNICTSKDKIFG